MAFDIVPAYAIINKVIIKRQAKGIIEGDFMSYTFSIPTAKDMARNAEIASKTPGYFKTVSKQASPDGVFPSEKANVMYFVPYDPNNPCPCGKKKPFHDCCLPYGIQQVFVDNPDNTVSVAMIYGEAWECNDFTTTRSALMACQELLCAEDSTDFCFWNFRPHVQGVGSVLYGTVALSPNRLELETLSEARYKALRQVITSALGGQLAAGQRTVEVFRPHVDDVNNLPDNHDEPLLEQYAQVRAKMNEAGEKVLQTVLHSELVEAAKLLRLDDNGQIAISSDNEGELLYDFALHGTKRHGKPVLEHFIRKNTADEHLYEEIFTAMRTSWVSLFTISSVTRQGILLCDCLSGDSKPLLLVDKSLISSATNGIGIFCRLFPIRDFHINAGWGFVIEAEKVERQVAACRQIIATSGHNRQLIRLIRHFQATGRELAIH